MRLNASGTEPGIARGLQKLAASTADIEDVGCAGETRDITALMLEHDGLRPAKAFCEAEPVDVKRVRTSGKRRSGGRRNRGPLTDRS